MALVSGSGGGGTASALASGKVSLTSGDLTTASATFVDATGLTVTVVTGAHRCLVSFSGTAQHTVNTTLVGFDIAVDGTRQGATQGLVFVSAPGAGNNFNASFSFITDVLTAASHTIKLQWKTAAATATLNAGANGPAVFSVVELYA